MANMWLNVSHEVKDLRQRKREPPRKKKGDQEKRRKFSQGVIIVQLI